MNKFDELPEDCIALILSLTSPQDVCNALSVSWAVHRATESDLLWENFLPSDYKEILSKLVTPILFGSKKELFMKMCSPLLIDGGTKEFSIERVGGKKCYKLSVRELSITWSSNALYWCRKPYFDSRFGEIMELITISWLEIKAKMNTKMLSPSTLYGAYLIVKFANRAYGLDALPSELLVEVGNYKSRGSIYLRPKEKDYPVTCLWTRHRSETLRSRVDRGEERVIWDRGDGWWEIKMGDFYCDGSDDKEVKMSLKEIKGEHLKGGLIVEGIELRPML